MPTTYNIHWGETDDLTVTDASGAAEKTGGAGGNFDASARAKQRFDGISTVIAKATYGVAGNMAFGVYAVNTTYTKGAVTLASLLACWSIEGANCVVRESNTQRYSGAVAISDVLEIHLVMTAGVASLLFKQNGTTRWSSTITSVTILGWRPWRFITTHAGAGSKWSAGTLDGESAEVFDPDVANSYAPALFEDPFDAIEYTATAAANPLLATREVHTPHTDGGTAAPGTELPYARAWVG